MTHQTEIVLFENERKQIVYYPLTGAVGIKTKTAQGNFYALVTEESMDDTNFLKAKYNFEQWVICR